MFLRFQLSGEFGSVFRLGDPGSHVGRGVPDVAETPIPAPVRYSGRWTIRSDRRHERGRAALGA